MTRVSYCLFETSLGPCGIAWTASDNASAPPAVTFFQLPEASARLTEARMAPLAGTREPSEPPPLIADVIEKVRLRLEGTAQDFHDVPLNMEGVGPFARAVYDIARNIPAGETRTYGEIAKSLNQPAAARAVGQALGRNPIPLLIPCHRVVAAGGKP